MSYSIADVRSVTYFSVYMYTDIDTMIKNSIIVLLCIIIGVLIYLMITRPDSLSVANRASLFTISPSVVSLPTSSTPNQVITSDESSSPLEHFLGTIVSDPAHAQEVDLGTDWYWLIFDKPQFMDPGARGESVWVSKLQISTVPANSPLKDGKVLKDYVGKRVDVYGKYGWGYAESLIIEPEVITILPLDQYAAESGQLSDKTHEKPEELFIGKIISDPAYADYVDLAHWYWFVFDEPYLVPESGFSTQPQYVGKLNISIISPDGLLNGESLDIYDRKHVAVTGHLGWGMAETRMIIPKKFTILP